MTMRIGVAGIGLALLVLAVPHEGTCQEEEQVSTQTERLFVANHLNPWPTSADGTTRIRVCFAQSAKAACDGVGDCDFAGRRELVAAALLRTWDVYSNLVLWDFGMCDAGGGSDNPEGAMVIRPEPGCQVGHANVAGYKSDNNHNSIFTLSFGSDADSCDDARDDGRWAGVVVHEVGHALGFVHEHQRPENFDASGRATRCLDGASPEPGTPLTSAYDPWSIMQYCTNNLTGWDGAPAAFGKTVFLSAGDIDGARTLYGTSDALRALRAAAAIGHLLR